MKEGFYANIPLEPERENKGGRKKKSKVILRMIIIPAANSFQFI
jgi:hypothetical protein